MGPYSTAAAVWAIYALVLSFALGRAGFRRGAGPAPAALPDAAPAPPASVPAPPARLLVVGGTGGTGRELVAQALARGHEVTVLARDPRRVRAAHPRLRVVAGDVLDPAAVAAALRGCRAVVCALGHKRWLGPTRILSRGTGNLLQAMRAEGARRLVCETSLGIGGSAGRMGLYYTFFVIPAILPFYFWDKTRQERAIAASGLEWVIVRPGALTNGPPRGSCRHGPQAGGFVRTRSIARSDVAAFMLDRLGSDDYLRDAAGIVE